MTGALIFSVLLIIAVAVLVLRKPKKNEVTSPATKTVFSAILSENVVFYQRLDAAGKEAFIQKVIQFLERTHIEGVGTEIEDIDRVLVAASAIIPIFNFGDWQYRNLTNVIVYPDTFNQQFQYEGKDRSVLGMVGTGFMHGQMILSKSALRNGFRPVVDGQNTAIHEFVHLLDKSDGSIDGIPQLLLQHSYIIPWVKAMENEIKRIEKGKSDINPYASTNEAEFLAVVSEYFFENPAKFQDKHPELYSMMETMFKP